MARWVGASLRRRLTGALSVPLIRRVIFHVRRLRDDLDIHFFRSLVASLAIIVTLSALLVTVAEPSKRSISGLVRSAYWAMTMVLGSGDSSYVDGPVGYLVGWALAFFGVAIVAALTAAVAGFVIDFILKEGQGMGASGYIDHIVICGWNPTARELIEELKGDEFKARVVIIHDVEHNPAGSGTYFVRGDPTSGDDLRRAGIEDAAAAVICPSDSSNDADMRSILSVLAIETIAPEVRTVVEVNNPKHVEHFERAHADEILVTPRLASRLLARSALYPGLASSSPTWCPAVRVPSCIGSGCPTTSSVRLPAPWPPCCGRTTTPLSSQSRGTASATRARPPTSCCARVTARSSSPRA